MRHLSWFGVLLAAGLVAVGCGSADVSTQRLTDTRAALEAAKQVGAEQEPQARLYLTYAQEEMERAEQLIEEDEETRAIMMLERAEADAELAMELAREAQVRREVQATMERIRALQANVSM